MEKSCCPFVVDATGNKTEEFFCTNCSRNFQSAENFASHLYAHTFVQKSLALEPVICSGCGLEFRNRENWQKHTKNTANYCPGLPKTMFGCQLCHKIFTQKHILRQHLKAHTNGKLWKYVQNPYYQWLIKIEDLTIEGWSHSFYRQRKDVKKALRTLSHFVIFIRETRVIHVRSMK